MSIRRRVRDGVEVQLKSPFGDFPKGHVFVVAFDLIDCYGGPKVEQWFSHMLPFSVVDNGHERGSD